MTERPILFSAPMVRALLAGAKTETRRAVKGEPLRWLDSFDPAFVALPENGLCPYGQPGDRLWVREAWRAPATLDKTPPRDITPETPIWYEAQDEVPFHPTAYGKLRPGMFMPRWASRITLEITGVRVERLQDISIEDAKAEGAWGPDESIVDRVAEYFGTDLFAANPRRAFQMLWEQINGTDSWAANPWVWAIEFRRLT